MAVTMSEMLKGVLEGMVLEIISQEEVYGYEIVKKFQELGFADIAEGTVYTILARLERGHSVTIVRRPSEIGPPRKFYSLNSKGTKELAEFWERWEFLQKKMEELRPRS